MLPQALWANTNLNMFLVKCSILEVIYGIVYEQFVKLSVLVRSSFLHQQTLNYMFRWIRNWDKTCNWDTYKTVYLRGLNKFYKRMLLNWCFFRSGPDLLSSFAMHAWVIEHDHVLYLTLVQFHSLSPTLSLSLFGYSNLSDSTVFHSVYVLFIFSSFFLSLYLFLFLPSLYLFF